MVEYQDDYQQVMNSNHNTGKNNSHKDGSNQTTKKIPLIRIEDNDVNLDRNNNLVQNNNSQNNKYMSDGCYNSIQSPNGTTHYSFEEIKLKTKENLTNLKQFETSIGYHPVWLAFPQNTYFMVK